MRLFMAACLVLVAMAASVCGVFIPEGTAAGAYTVETNAQGEEQLVFLQNLNSTLAIDPTRSVSDGRMPVARRDSPRFNPPYGTKWPKTAFHACNHYSMNYNNTDTATRVFSGACKSQSEGVTGRAFVYVHGDAVAYMCNYDTWNPCVWTEFWDAMDWIWWGCSTYDTPGLYEASKTLLSFRTQRHGASC